MASIKELHALCHSMNKAEKRFISIFVQGIAGKSKNNYLLQLENIWQIKQYDEPVMKKKMKNIPTKRISEFNSNLFEFISKGLMLYHSDKLESLSLAKEGMLTEIFLSKGLLPTANKRLSKIFEEHSGYGNSELLLHAHKLKYKLGLKQFDSFEQQIEVLDEKMAALDSVKNETAYQKLNFEMNQLFASETLPRNKKQAKVFQAFLKQDLLVDVSNAISNYAKHYHYMIKIPLLDIVGRKKEALSISNEAIKFTRENFDLAKDPIPYYLQLKRNLSLQYSIGDPKHLEATFNSIRELSTSSKLISSKVDIWSVELDMRINKSLAERKIKEGIQYFEKFAKDKLDKEFEQVNRLDAKALLIARMYFLNKDYASSLQYAELATKGNRYKFKYALWAAEFLILLNHYKLGNAQMLPYAVTSLKRALQNEDTLYPPEKALLSFLGKIKNPDNMQSELIRLNTVFKTLAQDPFNSVFFGNGDYLNWLEQEISSK